MKGSSGPAAVTVAIPTFNGEEYLAEVLEACLAQDTPFPVEVLVIDSGSNDATLEIVRCHPSVRLVVIPNSEFGHGRTRNLAMKLATGEIVAFLTQDATPADRNWLRELVQPFTDPSVAGVFGKQIARPGCCPPVKRNVAEAFRRPPPGFFSNVNSAIRGSIAQLIPFRDVAYAEDLGFALDAAAAGYRTVYAPASSVRHSHDLTIPDYFRRMYDETRGVRENDPARRPPSLVWLVGATVRGIFKDWWFVVTDDDPNRGFLVAWLVKVPVYNVARRTAIWLAYRDRLSADFGDRMSLDARRRRSAMQRA